MAVYFIVEGEKNYLPDNSCPIKVGISVDVKRRMQNLQTGNSQKLFLLGWIDASNDNSLETQMHELFAAANIRGEWFELNSHEVVEVLKQNNGNLARNRDQLQFIGYGRDAIPEFLNVWDWWDFGIEECCPYCGSFPGMYMNEQLDSYHCNACDTVDAWDNPEEDYEPPVLG